MSETIWYRVWYHYCSVAEAMELITHPFDGDKKRLWESIENVDVAFDIVHPSKNDILLKLVKTKITVHWVEFESNGFNAYLRVSEILEEHYAVRRTLHF